MKQDFWKTNEIKIIKKNRKDNGITFHHDSFQSYFELIEPIHQEDL